MKESFIMKLSFIGSIIGFVSIFLIVSQTNYDIIDINSITGEMIGETINITGVVKDLYIHDNGHVFVSLLDDTGEIKIVIWSDTVKQLEKPIKKNDFINVVGSVKLYEGELEIISKNVDVI